MEPEEEEGWEYAAKIFLTSRMQQQGDADTEFLRGLLPQSASSTPPSSSSALPEAQKQRKIFNKRKEATMEPEEEEGWEYAAKIFLTSRMQQQEDADTEFLRGLLPQCGRFSREIKSYLEKLLETAGLQKDYHDLRDLMIEEQTLNACPKDLAAHLRQKKERNLRALAGTAKRYLEAHNMKFAQKSLRSAGEEKQEDSLGGRGEVLTTITCFNCGSQGHKAARCPSKQLSKQLS
ncbi:hypothetical protein EGW08_023259 [Elysia chlorotica]|uniref:CCHC-type domain-containing protein n=1 Tax=Elysia chlorotica TaxID=188477 RepID=A0A3S0Z465_ELYCH|nr:hypothetical protein EGW08_023259 [Elysia chlorotica]